MVAHLDHPGPQPAETYERFMVPTLFAPAAEHIIELARPKPGDRVLDVGCGTGIVARRITARVSPHGSVTGLDPNPAMLAVARATALDEGLSIDWTLGAAELTSFPDDAFDLVLSQFALMFFDDRPRALREMRRILAPGGKLAVSVWQGIDRHPFYQALDRAIARHLGTSAVGTIFALGDASELRRLIMEAGFQHVTVEPFAILATFPDPDAFLAGEIDVDTASIPAMQSLDGPARQALTAAIAEEMANPLRLVAHDDQLRLRFHGFTALAS
jgi:ubiquinone/menaquinone biosynthesis C-methylase UbiE